MGVGRSSFFEAHTQDAGKAFNEDVARHFGLAKAAIHEDNWCFDDPVAFFEDAVGHLYLEGIALRLNGVKFEIFQHLTAITAEASSAVVDGDAQHEAGIDIAASADDTAEQ